MAAQRTSTRRRQEGIRNLVFSGTQMVDEIAKAMDVSPSTIRRDLTVLEDQGVVTRTLGGAIPSPQIREKVLAEREEIEVGAKIQIAKAAAELIPEEASVIFLDAGSSCSRLIPHLGNRGPLTVVTRGLEIALALADDPNIEVLLTGGKVFRNSHSLSGALFTAAVEKLYVDIAFLGCDAVHPVDGVGEPTLAEAQTKELIASRSNRTVVLAHASKLGLRQHAWAPMPRGWTLVTDERSRGKLKPYRAAGVQVVTA
ncbi:DeoR/GlpR family DNA-binding transcription regulator [Actinomyces minihominis]|uniref:DeoR/GlpR family DNA-binding transcription regulator n=1 Tax=Actinomyces minihominis TaxID=2002838 RepID=UPI000C06E447|nr:DeoR/GlpR family DNA-binding transcription regulator [Actinomyces minihominis]